MLSSDSSEEERMRYSAKIRMSNMISNVIIYVSMRSFKPPYWGGSNEYPQSMFQSKNGKNKCILKNRFQTNLTQTGLYSDSKSLLISMHRHALIKSRLFRVEAQTM